MKSETVVIELRRVTVEQLVAIAVGALLVCVVFLASFDPRDHWLTVNCTGIVAGAFIVGLAAYQSRPPIETKHRIFLWAGVIFTIGLLGWNWLTVASGAGETMAEFELMKSAAGRVRALEKGPEPLFRVLEARHDSVSLRRESLEATFRRLYPQASVGSNVYEARSTKDSTQVVVREIAPDRISVTFVLPMARGNRKQFVAVTGHPGVIQETFFLTNEGIAHEVEN